MPSPSVSILVTTYNHSRFVEEALDSLAEQTCRDFEVIITDDASTDGTPDVIQGWLDRTGFEAVFIRNPVNQGICKNRNKAIALSKGCFLCSLSGDDAYLPDRIERQLAFFRQQPESVAAVYSDVYLINEFSQITRIKSISLNSGNNMFFSILEDNSISAPAVMLRKKAVLTVGGYDEDLIYEDYDMWLRLSYYFDFMYMEGLVAKYRRLPTSLLRSPSTWRNICSDRVKIHIKTMSYVNQNNVTYQEIISRKLWEDGVVNILNRRFDSGLIAFNYSLIHDSSLKGRMVCFIIKNKIFLYIYYYYLKLLIKIRKSV